MTNSDLSERDPDCAERRQEPRTSVSFEGKLSHTMGTRRANVHDLSAAGCRFSSPGHPLERGSFVAMRLGSVGPLDARVKWASDTMCGIQFDRDLHVAVLDHVISTSGLSE